MISNQRKHFEVTTNKFVEEMRAALEEAWYLGYKTALYEFNVDPKTDNPYLDNRN